MRKLMIAGTVLILVIGGPVLGAAGCGSREPSHPAGTPMWNFGSLAGYATERPVHAIGASWTVPAVRDRSQDGESSNWIGAQQGFGNSPFIQVGTISRQTGKRDLPESAQYVAFWTDRAHHFKPIPLFEVTPLTTATASLRHVPGGWIVSVRDGARTVRFKTPQEASADFHLALWLAEDPGDPGSRAPYPAVTQTRFSALSVNGVRPLPSELESQWMTVEHRHFGPTRLEDDSFAIVPLRITPAGEHYLRVAAPLDRAFSAIYRQIERLDRTQPSKRADAFAADLRPGALAIEHFIDGLSHYSWPAGSRAAVAGDIAAQRIALAATHAPAGPGKSSRWVHEWVAGGPSANGAPALRAALGLPQVHPMESACRPAERSSEACAP